MQKRSTNSENFDNKSIGTVIVAIALLALIAGGVYLFYPTKNAENSTSVTDFPDGWHSISLNEFKDTPDFHYRQKNPTHGLEVQGDLDGDKKIDKVRLLQKNDRTECAVVATLIKGNSLKHHFIHKSTGRCLDNASLFVTNADQDPNIKAFQFIMGSYESAADLLYFDKGKFVNIIISD